MKIIGYHLEKETQVSFDSITDAASYLKLDRSHISKCLKGKRSSHGGYSWSVSSSDSVDWTPENDEVIRKYYPNGNLSNILQATKKDIVAVTARAKDLGLKRSQAISPANRSELDLVNFVISSDEREV